MLQSCWLKCWLIWALSHNRYLLFLSLLTPEDYRQTFLCTRLKHWSRAKKACLVWLRKLQDVRQITCLKQQRSLSFIFCKTQRSYEKIMCICYFIGSVVKIVLEATSGGVLYKKFTELPGNYKCQSLFFNEFAGAAMSLLIFLTWKSLNIVYRKVMKFFKVLPKKILRVHVTDTSCNRSNLLRCSMKKGVLTRPATSLKKRLWRRCFPVNFAKFLRTPFSQSTSEQLLWLQQSWRPATLLKKETSAQVFSCEYSRIFGTPFFIEQLWWLLLNYVLVSERILNKER